MVKLRRTPPPPTCSAVDANLVAYLKGGLSRAQEEAVRAHLLRCHSCAHRVQEARDLDAALYAAAPRRPHQPPPGFTSAVQDDVYRRMRRALVLQRTRALTGRVATALLSIVLLIGLGLMVGPWVRYLATAESTPTPPAIAAPVQPVPLPTVPPAQTAPVASYPVEYHSPADSTRALLEAAVAGDERRVARLLAGTRTRARRVRARLEPCRGALNVNRLHYTTVRYENNVAGVRIYYGEQLAGEVKLILRENGYWYLHYLHYDSFNAILGDGCLALP